MTYWTIALMADDSDLWKRVAASAAQEQILGAPIDGDPTQWTYQRRLTWASSPGWSEAWEYITITDPEPDPDPDTGLTPGWVPYGQRNDVISDGMILATVQLLAPRIPGPVQPLSEQPTSTWTRAAIIGWLGEHGLIVDPDVVTLDDEELLALVEDVLD